MAERREGGVDVRDVKNSVNVGGDVVGRDKVEQHSHAYLDTGVEEKSGCAFAFERAYTFVLSLLIAGGILAIIGALVGAGVGGEDGALIGGIAGGLLGLASAIVATMNVSRQRSV